MASLACRPYPPCSARHKRKWLLQSGHLCSCLAGWRLLHKMTGVRGPGESRDTAMAMEQDIFDAVVMADERWAERSGSAPPRQLLCRPRGYPPSPSASCHFFLSFNCRTYGGIHESADGYVGQAPLDPEKSTGNAWAGRWPRSSWPLQAGCSLWVGYLPG